MICSIRRRRPVRAYIPTERAGVILRSPKGGAGFTLIELLVVISIIAILAAILFPVFARAKDRARLTQCISNMHQLSVAILSYADDFEGTLPWWCHYSGDPVWDEAIWQYVRDKTIFTCSKNTPPGWKPGGTLIRSYALPRNVSGLGLGQIPSPARTMLLFEKGFREFGEIADATGECPWQTWGTDEWIKRPPGSPSDWYSVASRLTRTYWHGAGKVLSFVDGHAKYYWIRDQDPERNPFWYDFPDNKEHGTEHAPGFCGDAVQGYNYFGHGVHNPGNNLPR